MGTVALLAIPAVLLLIGAGLIAFHLGRGGIGGFTFAVKWSDIKIAAVAGLGFVLLLIVTGCWLVRRYRR